MVVPALHELNTGFAWERPSGPFTAITEKQAAAYCENGFFVMPGAFAPDAVDELLAEIDPVQERLAAMLDRRAAKPGFTIAQNLVRRSAKLRDICAGGVLAGVAHDLIGPRVRLYWEQAVYKAPDHSRAFTWHQDNGKTFLEPQQYITCWIALTDATVQNGCLVVAPGLHRRGTLSHWDSGGDWRCLEHDPEQTVAVPLQAGSLAVFSSVTTHMTTANLTDATRKAYVVQYAADGARAVRRAADGATDWVSQDAPDIQFLLD
jgi:phytanoyl-CoA hydroxylase